MQYPQHRIEVGSMLVESVPFIHIMVCLPYITVTYTALRCYTLMFEFWLGIYAESTFVLMMFSLIEPTLEKCFIDTRY